MNPMMMMGLMTALGALSGLGGKSGERSSTYTKGQRSKIDEILQSLKGAPPDITQNQNYQTGQDWLQSMFNDPQFFDQFEAPLQRQFSEQTIPELANRFASQGSGGSLGSTAFRNQANREAGNLSTNIAALRGGMQQQAIPQLMGYSQQPFSNYMTTLQQALTPTQNVYQPPSTGFLGGVLPGLIGGISQGAGQQWGQNMSRSSQYYNPGQNPSTF